MAGHEISHTHREIDLRTCSTKIYKKLPRLFTIEMDAEVKKKKAK